MFKKFRKKNKKQCSNDSVFSSPNNSDNLIRFNYEYQDRDRMITIDRDFLKITSYFGAGNSRFANRERAKLLGISSKNTRVAPGVNLRSNEFTKIGNCVYIGLFTYINGSINIEDDCIIGPYCCLTSNNHIFNPVLQSFQEKNEDKKIRIKRGSWLAAGVVITPGVTIGECNLVCAGAVVTKDTPDYSIVAGIPGAVVGYIDSKSGQYKWIK